MTPEERLSHSYHSLLVSIDWTDELIVKGLREGLNKFLSNAFASMFPGLHKYHRTHLVSQNALAQLRIRDYENLIYEHLVPKSYYIQQPSEQLAMQGKLTVYDIHELLKKYWKIATITVAEDALLHRRRMPPNWDEIDPLARYRAVGIELELNPYFPIISA
jgi:hypothetical protein